MRDVMTIEPPGNLNAVERMIFAEIIEERPAQEWTPHRLQVAAILAQELRAQCEEQEAARREGSVMDNDRGSAILNPRVAAIRQRTMSILSLRRSLAIHARALHGQIREIGRRRQIHLEQEDAALTRDNLIAWPKGGDDDRTG